MVQIPILSGIYTDTSPDLRTSYPVNMVPVPKASGISAGYLRPAEGIVQTGAGIGEHRGGIEWGGDCYRVIGSSLVLVGPDGTYSTLGDVGNNGTPVSMDYSFDRLAIASSGRLFYLKDGAVSQVTDPDLGYVRDVIWIDGFFMTTDGEYLVVTDLNDPTAINPLKYGSSEVDPDLVVALKKTRNEVYAINRHTIEIFDNIGGPLFPFQRIESAQIQKGCVGTHACCVFMEAIAFLGSGRNEQIAVYLGVNSQASKISTQEVDDIISGYPEPVLAQVELETRNDGLHQYLYVHLPDRCLVYDAGASMELGQPVWFVLSSSEADFSEYRARYFVRAYNKWLCADPGSGKMGYLSKTISSHWGEKVRWEFSTLIVYNDGAGAIFNELELVGLTGSYAFGDEPVLSTSYSADGLLWSQDRVINAGVEGSRAKRLVWFQQGHMRNWRIQRFRGDSDCHASFMRLEARLEPLAY